MKTLALNPELYNYILSHAPAISPVLDALKEETASLPASAMQISPDQGAFLNFLAKMITARRILEIGCFTGYSAICMAAALPSDGRLISLDLDKDTGAIARRYFRAAELDDKIELRLGPASESLVKLNQEFGEGSFDLTFIDADKENMTHYYEQALEMTRPGGIIVADNVLWSGSVVDISDQSTSTVAIRKFNEHIKGDSRVDRIMLHVADGLYLIRKK